METGIIASDVRPGIYLTLTSLQLLHNLNDFLYRVIHDWQLIDAFLAWVKGMQMIYENGCLSPASSYMLVSKIKPCMSKNK